MTLNGRGPCVINELETSLTRNYIKLDISQTHFFTQCAGPSYISIHLPEKEVNDKGFKCKLSEVQCKVSEWSEWSGCAERSIKKEQRSRIILIQPEFSSMKCPELDETRECVHNDCQVSEWSEWIPISYIEQQRTRQIIAAPNASGKQCPHLIEKRDYNDCKVGEWSDWRRISDTQQERNRQIAAEPSNGGKQCPQLSEGRQIGGRIKFICNVFYFNLKFY